LEKCHGVFFSLGLSLLAQAVLAESLGMAPHREPAAAPPPSAAAAAPALLAQADAVSINDILRLAFDVAQHARQEDATGNLKGAFELYTQCLESFLVVYSEEQNPALKDQLRSTILEYTERAEAIKKILNNTPPPSAQVAPVRAIPAGIRNEDVDGPFTQAVRKAHPGHSGAVDLVVTLPKRKYVLDEIMHVHIDVDNQCGRTVEKVKCYLLQTVDSYYWKSPDAQERKSEVLKTMPRQYKFGKVFPLQNGLRFEGNFEYELGPRLKPTERKDPTVLVREYVLVVKCFFKRPWRDLKAYIPISIFAPE
jgi:hypothetical protein